MAMAARAQSGVASAPRWRASRPVQPTRSSRCPAQNLTACDPRSQHRRRCSRLGHARIRCARHTHGARCHPARRRLRGYALRQPTKTFEVIYLAQVLTTAIAETLGRDPRPCPNTPGCVRNSVTIAYQCVSCHISLVICQPVCDSLPAISNSKSVAVMRNRPSNLSSEHP
jgi:hypothetical protein